MCERVSLSCMVNLILCQWYSESRRFEHTAGVGAKQKERELFQPDRSDDGRTLGGEIKTIPKGRFPGIAITPRQDKVHHGTRTQRLYLEN